LRGGNGNTAPRGGTCGHRAHGGRVAATRGGRRNSSGLGPWTGCTGTIG